MAIKIVPIYGSPFNIKGFNKALRKTLREEGAIDKRLLQQTTATWRGSKPRFKVVEKVTPQELSVTVIPTGRSADKWWWLEKGVKRRWIRPRKRGGRLFFKTGGKPKTRVGRLKSGRGKRGKDLAVAKAVDWPGIKARNWRMVIHRMRKRLLLKKLRVTFRILARSPLERSQ